MVLGTAVLTVSLATACPVPADGTVQPLAALPILPVDGWVSEKLPPAGNAAAENAIGAPSCTIEPRRFATVAVTHVLSPAPSVTLAGAGCMATLRPFETVNWTLFVS